MLADNRVMGGLYLSTRMHNRLRSEARRRGCSMQEVIRQSLWEYFFSRDSTGPLVPRLDVVFSQKKRHIRRKDLDNLKPTHARVKTSNNTKWTANLGKKGG